MIYSWTTPIRYIQGLGPTRSRELIKIGIETVGDLLEKHPLSYIYPGVTNIADATGGMVVIRATVTNIRRGWGSTVEAVLDDGTGTCRAIWYHGAHTLNNLFPGKQATFWGKMKGGVLQQPKWTTVESTMENVYGGQYGVHHDTIRAALVEVTGSIVELPDRQDGGDRISLYFAFHFPKDREQQRWALQTLKFDEALTLQLALAERRRERESVMVKPIVGRVPGVDTRIMAHFPYEFTDDQNDAIIATIKDMTDCVPMQRLIHGEVGSGKTAVAFYSAMLAALNDKRTLILAPTTILAQQHYDTLKSMGWGDVALFATKDDWDAHIVIGTHAMLNNDYLMRKSSLVIIDEMQKFGVEQRAQVTKYHPHLLLLSATPIPRTLATSVFGDLDVSLIRQLPTQRGTVVTRWVLPDKREAMYSIIERELAKGHQAYVVYPRISGDEDVVSAERGLAEWTCRYDTNDSELDGSDVAILTGRTSAENKQDIFRQFKAGHIRVLISTVIAEVGLDNPNATVMVIEGADRFGLSQLHQLRGRVCRSISTAFCFLVSETSNPTSIARLEVIEKCNDGFEIAEEDLRLRGAGEVFSTRQSGLPDLKWCSVVDDFDLMIEAKETVQAGSVGSGPKVMMKMKYEGLLQFGGVT